MTATGRKKLDELYHSVTERSEFYSMVDLHKPPVLFSPPAEHTIDKVPIETSDLGEGNGRLLDWWGINGPRGYLQTFDVKLAERHNLKIIDTIHKQEYF